MFYLYWILMMMSLLSAFAFLSRAIRNRNYSLMVTSLIQCLLSVCLPFLNLVIVNHHFYENEFEFLWNCVAQGDFVALMLLFAYLVLFALVVLNGKKIINKKGTMII